VFGETLDMGVGNFIDQVARALGLGFPGGPLLEKLAKKGSKLIELPYSLKGMDVNFGGLYTLIKKYVKEKKYKKEDLAYSIQEYIFAMLIEALERAVAHLGKKEVSLGGGVACNSRLQEMLKIMAKERGLKYYIPPKEVLVDNGVMIAWLGLVQYVHKANILKVEKARILPYQRTDEVRVTWR